jgi:hypothetical protein
MLKRTYSCNLCGKAFEPQNACIIGYEWGGNPHRMIYKPAHAVENHLCADCIEGIPVLANEARKNGHPLK